MWKVSPPQIDIGCSLNYILSMAFSTYRRFKRWVKVGIYKNDFSLYNPPYYIIILRCSPIHSKILFRFNQTGGDPKCRYSYYHCTTTSWPHVWPHTRTTRTGLWSIAEWHKPDGRYRRPPCNTVESRSPECFGWRHDRHRRMLVDFTRLYTGKNTWVHT